MTERKPPGVSWESWVDRQIREAQERGEFDNLPGAGQPIRSLDQPHDELWWVKQLLEREQIAVTPPGLEVRKAFDEARDNIARARTESAVREIVAGINAKIIAANAKPAGGPPTTLMPLDADKVVENWSRQHQP